MTQLIKYLIFKIWRFRINLICYLKLKKLMRINGPNLKKDGNLSFEYKEYWKKFGLRVNPDYYHLYSFINNIKNPRYVPENVYYSVIEPAMNNKIMSKTYTNKNIYDILYQNLSNLPNTVVRRIDGIYYNKQYEIVPKEEILLHCKSYNSIIVKKSLDSGGGHGIELFIKEENGFFNKERENLSYQLLEKKFPGDIVIQEYIYSNSFFAKFNKSSLNTIRIFTYRSVIDEHIYILHTILRIGKEGSIVDNQASGGISCGIHNGYLNSYAIDKWGKRYYEVGGHNFSLQEKIPQIKNINDVAVSIAKVNPYSRLLGLDLCVDNTNKVRLIEVNNSNNEINFYQMNNGPLFSEFTDDIIIWSLNAKKTMCFDFYV